MDKETFNIYILCILFEYLLITDGFMVQTSHFLCVCRCQVIFDFMILFAVDFKLCPQLDGVFSAEEVAFILEYEEYYLEEV